MCFSHRLAVPVTCVLETGAGPNVLNSLVIAAPVLWNLSRPPDNNPLVDANERPLNLRDCLLGTNFIDRHVKAILPGSHTVALRQGGRIAILGCYPANAPNIGTGFVCDPRLVILQNHPRLPHPHLTLMAIGIVDNIPNQPFKVCLSPFSSHDVKLPKNTNVGIALPAPQGVFTVAHTDLGEVAFDKEGGCANASTTTKVSINTNSESKPTDKASVDREEGADPERQWKDTVQIGQENGQLWGRIIDLLEEFETMRSGHLGQIKATQYRIELLPDSKPIYQQPYRAGPKARKVEL
ncbi:unnamed protein product [Agarophyton chilense]